MSEPSADPLKEKALREDLQERRNRAKAWAEGYQQRTDEGPGKHMYVHAWMCGYFNHPMTSSSGLEAEIIKQFEALAAHSAAPVEREPKTGTEIMLRAAAERERTRWKDIENRLREARRGNTKVEQFYLADVQWLVDMIMRFSHLRAALAEREGKG